MLCLLEQSIINEFKKLKLKLLDFDEKFIFNGSKPICSSLWLVLRVDLWWVALWWDETVFCCCLICYILVWFLQRLIRTDPSIPSTNQPQPINYKPIGLKEIRYRRRTHSLSASTNCPTWGWNDKYIGKWSINTTSNSRNSFQWYTAELKLNFNLKY